MTMGTTEQHRGRARRRGQAPRTGRAGGGVLRARSPEGRYKVAKRKPVADPKARLTRVELSLMEGLCAGMTNAEIAATIGRSEKTVRNQLTKVYAKLGVSNRAGAVALYLRRHDE